MKKGTFKDFWCENKNSKIKCQFRKMVWDDLSIPPKTYKTHNGACRLKRKRVRPNPLNVNRDRENVKIDHKETMQTKIKDYKIEYMDIAKKGKDAEKDNSLKIYEDEAEVLFPNGEITKVTNFSNLLNEVEAKIVLQEAIRRVQKQEKDDALSLYKEAFSQFELNQVMKDWVFKEGNVGIQYNFIKYHTYYVS